MKPFQKFLIFLKSELQPTPSKIKFAIKITICAVIGACLATYANLVFHLNFGWWILSTIFSIPTITFKSTFIKSNQRILATIIGCLIGYLLSFYVQTNSLSLFIVVAVNTFIWSFLKAKYPAQDYTFVLSGILCFMIFSCHFITHEPKSLALIRLSDTIIGSAIVLIMFYIIWPSNHNSKIKSDEIKKNIHLKLSNLFIMRVSATNTKNSHHKIHILIIEIIDNLTQLKQLENDAENFNSNLKCETLLCLINNIQLPETETQENKLFEDILKKKYFEIYQLMKQILKNENANIENIIQMKQIINDLLSQRMKFIEEKKYLNYSVIENLKFYEFIDIIKEIVKLYDNKIIVE